MVAARLTENLPSVDYLRECFDYDPETGVLTWKCRPLEHFTNSKGRNIFLSRYAGKVVGCLSLQGYLTITIGKTKLLAHRVAWCVHYGVWPTYSVDHINLNKADNRIENLRDIEEQVNSLGRARYRTNVSGCSGVGYLKDSGKWKVSIGVRGKKVYLGLFESMESAVAAYEEAKKFHTYSTQHGIAQPTVRPDLRVGHVQANNSSGTPGVWWHEKDKRWCAGITVKGIRMRLGSFREKADAVAARRAAEEKYGITNSKGRGRVATPPVARQ